MDAQVVYESDTAYDMQYGPHGYERVGIRIENRVIWLACDCWTPETREEYKRWERIANQMVGALKGEEG